MDGVMNTRQRLEKILLQKNSDDLISRRITLDEIDDLIHGTKTYYLLHKQSTGTGQNRIEHIRGDKLLSFLKDYIEPDSGDGLELDVFPETMHWHLSFTIDGLIYYSVDSQQASPESKK